MAINLFAPTVWSESLCQELDKQYIAVAHCSREYEGEIKQCGDTVRIVGLNPIKVFDYTKNTDMTSPAALSETLRELKISQAKYFNFQIDDIDRAQTHPDLMKLAMKSAANALSDAADKYVFEVCKQGGTLLAADVSNQNLIDTIINARTIMYANGVGSTEEVFVEVSPEIAKFLFKEKREMIFDNSNLIETGCIGTIHGCKVFVSHNIPTDAEEEANIHHCFMRTKNAIVFAEQLSEIDAYRPELRFADAVKGLHLYGAKALRHGEIVRMDFSIPLTL